MSQPDAATFEQSLRRRRRLFAYLSRRTRALFFGLVLLAGCLGGMAMRPEEMEELLSTMHAQKIVQVAKAEEPGLPPID